MSTLGTIFKKFKFAGFAALVGVCSLPVIWSAPSELRAQSNGTATQPTSYCGLPNGAEPGPNEAFFYTEKNYNIGATVSRVDCINRQIGENYDRATEDDTKRALARQMTNKRVKSVKIGSNVQLEICTLKRFAGKCHTFEPGERIPDFQAENLRDFSGRSYKMTRVVKRDCPTRIAPGSDRGALVDCDGYPVRQRAPLAAIDADICFSSTGLCQRHRIGARGEVANDERVSYTLVRPGADARVQIFSASDFTGESIIVDQNFTGEVIPFKSYAILAKGEAPLARKESIGERYAREDAEREAARVKAEEEAAIERRRLAAEAEIKAAEQTASLRPGGNGSAAANNTVYEPVIAPKLGGGIYNTRYVPGPLDRSVFDVAMTDTSQLSMSTIRPGSATAGRALRNSLEAQRAQRFDFALRGDGRLLYAPAGRDVITYAAQNGTFVMVSPIFRISAIESSFAFNLGERPFLLGLTEDGRLLQGLYDVRDGKITGVSFDGFPTSMNLGVRSMRYIGLTKVSESEFVLLKRNGSMDRISIQNQRWVRTANTPVSPNLGLVKVKALRLNGDVTIVGLTSSGALYDLGRWNSSEPKQLADNVRDFSEASGALAYISSESGHMIKYGNVVGGKGTFRRFIGNGETVCLIQNGIGKIYNCGS